MRHTKTVGKYKYAWGYDVPLEEYFFEKYDLESEGRNKIEKCVFAIGSHTTLVPHPDYPQRTRFSNSLILEIMTKEDINIPEDHLNKIAVDLPF